MWPVDDIFLLPGVITSLYLDTVSAHNGRQPFAVAGPTAWNSLSDDLRDSMLSTDSFGHLFKTWLFSEYQYIQRIRGITLCRRRRHRVASEGRSLATW